MNLKPLMKITFCQFAEIVVVTFLVSYVGLLQGQKISSELENVANFYNDKEYEKGIALIEDILSLDTQMSPVDRIELYQWMGRLQMHNWDNENASKSYEIAYELSNELGVDSLIISSGRSLEMIYSFSSKSELGAQILRRLLKLDIKDRAIKSELYGSYAGYFDREDKLDSAIYYSEKATYIDSIYRDTSSIIITFTDLGEFLVRNNQYKKGIQKFLYGMDHLRPGLDDFKKHNIQIRLGNLYLDIGNISKARNFAIEALKYGKEMSYQRLQYDAYNLLAGCASYENKLDEALTYYMKSDSANEAKAKNIYRGSKAKLRILHTRLDMGEKVSDADVQEIIEYGQGTNTKLTINNLNILKLRISNQVFADFDRDYNLYFDLAEAEVNQNLKLHFYNAKKEYFIRKNMLANALAIGEKIDIEKKEIGIENNTYIIQDLEARYRKDELDREIDFLAKENESNEKVLAQQRRTIFIGGGALVLISLLSFFLFRLYKKVNAQRKVISKTLAEKDLLLREIHHRVKNNLQMVSSLLSLQGRSIDNVSAQKAIQEGKNRVRSMALIHQDLYNKDNITHIGVHDYIVKLSRELVSSFDRNGNIQLNIDVGEIDLDIDTMIPLGLIMNELMTNSFKYAFEENTIGKIDIQLVEQGNTYVFTIVDNGKGYNPQNVRENSFGSTLIKALTKQLDGIISVNTDNGTRVDITFPKIAE